MTRDCCPKKTKTHDVLNTPGKWFSLDRFWNLHVVFVYACHFPPHSFVSRHIPICISFPRLRICMSFPNSTSLHTATLGLEHKLHLPTQLPASFHHGEPCRVSPRSSVRVKSPCWATTRSYGIGKPRKTVRGRQCDECAHGLKRGLCRAYSLIHLLHWQDVKTRSVMSPQR